MFNDVYLLLLTVDGHKAAHVIYEKYYMDANIQLQLLTETEDKTIENWEFFSVSTWSIEEVLREIEKYTGTSTLSSTVFESVM
ncbi:hypothetical protein [Listeria costaricensis]|uniref:hypothetical protein n=1 Tax=Listeria costaricensis TaxID=2026604 RepID=UPI000C0727F0|nr:hypothetical protein [Listeria costaricensis]